MSSTSATLEDLIALIEAQPRVWIRLAAARVEETWRLLVLEVTSRFAPPRWRELAWEYPSGRLLAFDRRGEVVAGWLRRGRIRVRSIAIPLPLQASVSLERKDSFASGPYEQLPWPTEEWHFYDASTNRPTVFFELIGEAAPSFASFQTAVASLLGLDAPPQAGLDGREFVFRHQDDVGRIASVQIRAAEIQISVEGTSLRGSVVELAGPHPGPSRVLARNRQAVVRFPLPEGLPAGSWVVLRKGSSWLDRRFLSRPYAREPEVGVEFLIEPATELQAIVFEGEGSTVEFKELLPGEDEDSKRKAMKTVAAFANGAGGVILFGVNDAGDIIGLERVAAGPRVKDRLAQLVRDWVSPLVAFEIVELPLPDDSRRVVLALSVEEGPHPPYGAGKSPSNTVYYVRRGSNSFPIGPSEVRALALRRPPAVEPFSQLRG